MPYMREDQSQWLLQPRAPKTLCISGDGGSLRALQLGVNRKEGAQDLELTGAAAKGQSSPLLDPEYSPKRTWFIT